MGTAREGDTTVRREAHASVWRKDVQGFVSQLHPQKGEGDSSWATIRSSHQTGPRCHNAIKRPAMSCSNAYRGQQHGIERVPRAYSSAHRRGLGVGLHAQPCRGVDPRRDAVRRRAVRVPRSGVAAAQREHPAGLRGRRRRPPEGLAPWAALGAQRPRRRARREGRRRGRRPARVRRGGVVGGRQERRRRLAAARVRRPHPRRQAEARGRTHPPYRGEAPDRRRRHKIRRIRAALRQGRWWR